MAVLLSGHKMPQITVNLLHDWIHLYLYFSIQMFTWESLLSSVPEERPEYLPWASSLIYDWHIISLIRSLDFTEWRPADLCVVFNNAGCILGRGFHRIFFKLDLLQTTQNKVVYILRALQPALDMKQPELRSRMFSIVSPLWGSAPVVFPLVN